MKAVAAVPLMAVLAVRTRHTTDPGPRIVIYVHLLEAGVYQLSAGVYPPAAPMHPLAGTTLPAVGRVPPVAVPVRISADAQGAKTVSCRHCPRSNNS